MRPIAALPATLAFAAVPAAALGGLALSGAGTVALLVALLAVLAASTGLALVWAVDLRRLQAALSGLEATPRLGAHLVLLEAVHARARREAVALEATRRDLVAERELLERLPDPAVLLDADRLIRRANRAARTSYGADLAAVLRHPGLRVALDRAAAAPQAASLSLPVPVPREVEAAVIRLEGAGPERDGSGRTLVVLSDRSRERAVERMRADFVANASHELRTPLASLIGFIETLQGPAADDRPAQERFLRIMAEQAARMNRLIDDLLSLSRIELSEHQPPTGSMDLLALCTRLLAAFEPRLTATDMRLELDAAPDLPPVAGDSDQVAQVLQNLFDNAVKYGGEGGVLRVSLSRAQGGIWPARPGVLLSVGDDGPGISAADLPRLTERFYRVDRRRSRAVGGTGLGLAIVKHVVNRHRGRLLIESDEGQGTVVRVWLPAASAGE